MASTSVVFDILAKDNASAKFDHLGNAIHGSSTKMAVFTGIMQGVGQAAFRAIGVGIREAVGGLVGMAKAAIEDQHSVTLLQTAVENATGATDAQAASLDKWVGKLSLASGIADDDLRPALARLVTATGDVGTSQDLMKLAMDASAVTGKSLEQVTAALARGYNGTTGSLGRLGIATKDASGEALTFNQITDAMQQKFAGGMQASASTAAGSMARLHVAISEAGESIGYMLLPYVTKLANWLTSDVVPALQKFINQMQNGRGEGGRFAAQMKDIGEHLKSATTFLIDNKDAVFKVAGALAGLTAALKVARTAQIALNIAAATNPYIALASAVLALGAAYAYAYKHSESFRSSAQSVNQVLINQGAAVVGTGMRVKGLLTSAMIGLTGAAMNVAHTFTSMGLAIAGAIDGAISRVQSLIAWIGKIHMPNLPGGLGGLLGGKRMAPGGNGIDVGDAGGALIESIVKGIDKHKVKLDTALSKLKDYIQKHLGKLSDLLDKRQGIVDAFKGFSTSLFSADLSGGDDGSGPKGIDAVLNFAHDQHMQADQLNNDVKSLIAKGISTDLLTQLQGSGAAGIEQIHALAQGTGEQIALANAENLATQTALQEAGLAASKAQGVEAAIAQEKANIKLAEQIKDGLKELLDLQDKNTVVELNLDGHRILWSLKKIKRQNGGHLGLGDGDP